MARVLDAVAAGTANTWDTNWSVAGDVQKADVPEHCPASIFEGHTVQDIIEIDYFPVNANMPTGIPNSELVRLKTLYLVSFFERYLAHNFYFARFLSERYAEENEPLIHFGVGDFPGSPELVLVCHQGSDELIEPTAFHEHLDHGDTRGGCGE